MGSHTTLKDKHVLVLFYNIINGLVQSRFATDEHAYTSNLMSIGNFYCLPLFCTTSYCSSFIQSSIKFWSNLHAVIINHKFNSFLSQNLKKKYIPQVYKHFNFGNRKETIFDVNFGIKLVFKCSLI